MQHSQIARLTRKMKKVGIVVGTRPNFIKISQFEKEFEKYPDQFEYKLIHTGQHFDDAMSKVFFRQLELKEPDVFLNIQRKKPAWQIGEIIKSLSDFFTAWTPDLLFVVGDVNSTLAAAITAQKEGIKIAHLESGLRSGDLEMPEEINRILTDQITDYFFVTEQSGLDNLLTEGKIKDKIFFVGNTMIDTLVAFDQSIGQSPILNDLGIEPQQFVLMTMHRPSNVDNKVGLDRIFELMEYLDPKIKIVFPMHPRTRQRIASFGLEDRLDNLKQLIITPPMDYFAFQRLIKDCKFVLTDSGGIQEETTFRRVPCLTLRNNTERPSTIQVGTNILLDTDIDSIKANMDNIFSGSFKKGEIPPLWDGKTTERIVDLLSELL